MPDDFQKDKEYLEVSNFKKISQPKLAEFLFSPCIQAGADFVKNFQKEAGRQTVAVARPKRAHPTPELSSIQKVAFVRRRHSKPREISGNAIAI